MGLTLRLAVEGSSFAHDLPALNAALTQAGLPPHLEPDLALEKVLGESALDDLREADWWSFPYGFLHYLRRIAVHARLDPAWVAEEIDDPDDDPVYASFAEEYFDTEELEGSHLYCHSDCDGFYVPIDFKRIIVARDLPGRFLGSSQRLLAEVAAAGQKIGFDWRGEKPSAAEIKRALAEIDEGMPFYREKYVFVGLHETARLSVAFKTAIVFS